MRIHQLIIKLPPLVFQRPCCVKSSFFIVISTLKIYSFSVFTIHPNHGTNKLCVPLQKKILSDQRWICIRLSPVTRQRPGLFSTSEAHAEISDSCSYQYIKATQATRNLTRIPHKGLVQKYFISQEEMSFQETGSNKALHHGNCVGCRAALWGWGGKWPEVTGDCIRKQRQDANFIRPSVYLKNIVVLPFHFLQFVF